MDRPSATVAPQGRKTLSQNLKILASPVRIAPCRRQKRLTGLKSWLNGLKSYLHPLPPPDPAVLPPVTSVKSYPHCTKLYLLGCRRPAPASNARFTRSKAHKISHLPSFQPHFSLTSPTKATKATKATSPPPPNTMSLSATGAPSGMKPSSRILAGPVRVNRKIAWKPQNCLVICIAARRRHA